MRVEFVTATAYAPWPCDALATTVVTLVTAIGLRATDAGRMLRGMGALAATIFGRSTGDDGAGA